MTNKGKVEIMAGGCIFDMDGLLFDTERIFQDYWRAIAAERGIVLADSFTRRNHRDERRNDEPYFGKILPHGGRRGNSERLQRKGFAPSGIRMYLSKRERWKYSDAAACLASKPRWPAAVRSGR